ARGARVASLADVRTGAGVSARLPAAQRALLGPARTVTASSYAVRALLLLLAANAAPWILGRLLGARFGWPLDFGATLPDRRRLFGDHKTWRGLAGGALACGLVASLFGLRFSLGVWFGALALAGDALSSLIKRRLGFAPGRDVPVVDQLPEALLPLGVLASALHLRSLDVACVAIAFILIDLAALRVRHRPGTR